MGPDRAGAEAGLGFAVSDANGQNAQALLEELNGTLTGILGHNGTKHVCMDDFSRDGGFFLVGYDEGVPVCCAGVRLLSEGFLGTVEEWMSYGDVMILITQYRSALVKYRKS